MTTSTRTSPAPTILVIEARDHRTGPALFARIDTDVIGNSVVLNLSQLAGESGWTIDATFAGSFPVHVNGFGARFCITKKVHADLASQLDAAAETLGLVEPDVDPCQAAGVHVCSPSASCDGA